MPLDALPHSHHRNDLAKVRDGNAFIPQLEEEEKEKKGEKGEVKVQAFSAKVRQVLVRTQCEFYFTVHLFSRNPT